MDIIFSASIIAAFFAGMVALFAPCCITILLPAYLASAFRRKRGILRMTFVFFAGIAAVLVPIGLGAASLAALFRNFHSELYIFGGGLMLLLGFMALAGKGLALIPMGKRAVKLDAGDSKSVFALGLFSGAATSCCAPVLAGAVTLAVISASFWKALVVTFAYVFGMTIPLFAAAYFYERFNIAQSRFIRGKIWEIRIIGKPFFIHSTNLLAALVFFLMGGILLLLGISGTAFWAPSYQVKIGEFLNSASQKIVEPLMVVPDIIWGIIIAGIFVFFLFNLKKLNRKKQESSE